MGPHGWLHFQADYDTLEDARQAAAVSIMHGYHIEDSNTRKVVENGLVGDLASKDDYHASEIHSF